ncbi:unnamed protein product [Psylliodes chrysocephalus]|uniref:Uncharacterized protein n=1 Tax=Psylliodes chrysocephalus TaxID=3402493 RepID=A0A9P0GHL9_9CUCU|nr:unnamed protein product [Psylliodes chrysocephala]
MVSRMIKVITSEIEVKIDKIYLWNDSRTVLIWIKSENLRFKIFVAHRIGEILEIIDRNDWQWISTKENVADEATRAAKHMFYLERWFYGPKFLQLNKELPIQDLERENRQEISEDELEIRKSPIMTLQNISNQSVYLPDPRRFSKLERLVRSTAWVLRFSKALTKTRVESNRKYRINRKLMNFKNLEALTVDEIENAENSWRYKKNIMEKKSNKSMMEKI